MVTTNFERGQRYTRSAIRSALGDPSLEGGDWDTGYREWNGEFFIFAGIGAAGRTGHDYKNEWEGEHLRWQAKGGRHLRTRQIRSLISGRLPVHLFTRTDEQDPFTYEGLIRAEGTTDTEPVGVTWLREKGWRRPLAVDEIGQILREIGFTLEPMKQKSQRASIGDLVVYLKAESESFVLVIDPSFDDRIGELRAIPGVSRPLPDTLWVHNSSFRSFRKRINNGKAPIPFGLDFDFYTSAALGEFVAVLQGLKVLRTPGSDGSGRNDGRNRADVDPQTETEATRAARLGQTKFRKDLFAAWRCKCALTGLKFPDLLRASHIKPWAESSGLERLDPDNGLLLAVHVDVLFDKGWISFSDDGEIMFSPTLNPTVLSQLGLMAGLRIVGLSEGNRRYLAIHRERHFTSQDRPQARQAVNAEAS